MQKKQARPQWDGWVGGRGWGCCTVGRSELRWAYRSAAQVKLHAHLLPRWGACLWGKQPPHLRKGVYMLGASPLRWGRVEYVRRASDSVSCLHLPATLRFCAAGAPAYLQLPASAPQHPPASSPARSSGFPCWLQAGLLSPYGVPYNGRSQQYANGPGLLRLGRLVESPRRRPTPPAVIDSSLIVNLHGSAIRGSPRHLLFVYSTYNTFDRLPDPAWPPPSARATHGRIPRDTPLLSRAGYP